MPELKLRQELKYYTAILSCGVPYSTPKHSVRMKNLETTLSGDRKRAAEINEAIISHHAGAFLLIHVGKSSSVFSTIY